MNPFQQHINQLNTTHDFSDLYRYSSDGNINWAYYYYMLFRKIPLELAFNYLQIDKNTFLPKLIETFGDDLIRITNEHFVDDDDHKTKISGFVYVLNNEILLNAEHSLRVYHAADTDQSILDKITQLVLDNLWKDADPIDKIFILNTRPHTGYYFDDFDIKYKPLDLQTNYNDDLLPVDTVITDRLSKEKDKGLVILYGKPGTGKTSYIRHLIHHIKKRKLFIPPSLAQHIADPQFISLLNSYQDSILIIEDAENIIQQRHAQSSSAISNLLNLTDGLLSDCFNIQIICTFNSDISSIDKALLRKGRLIAKYEFKELNAVKAQALSNLLGYTTTINTAMTIADVYNQNDLEPIEDRKSIGF